MSARDPLGLYHHDQEGSDATGSWFARTEIVQGRVVENVYRDKRYKPNARMSLDEAEHFHRASLEKIANERTRLASLAPSTKRTG